LKFLVLRGAACQDVLLGPIRQANKTEMIRRLVVKKFFASLRSLPAKPKRCEGWRLSVNLHFHDNLLVSFIFLSS